MIFLANEAARTPTRSSDTIRHLVSMSRLEPVACPSRHDQAGFYVQSRRERRVGGVVNAIPAWGYSFLDNYPSRDSARFDLAWLPLGFRHLTAGFLFFFFGGIFRRDDRALSCARVS